MDLSRRWTVFSCEAEYDAFGMTRLVKEHNALVDRLEAELSRREAEAGEVVAVIDGHFPEVVRGTTVFAEDLEHFTDDPHHDTIPVTVTIRRRAEKAKG